MFRSDELKQIDTIAHSNKATQEAIRKKYKTAYYHCHKADDENAARPHLRALQLMITLFEPKIPASVQKEINRMLDECWSTRQADVIKGRDNYKSYLKDLLDSDLKRAKELFQEAASFFDAGYYTKAREPYILCHNVCVNCGRSLVKEMQSEIRKNIIKSFKLDGKNFDNEKFYRAVAAKILKRRDLGGDSPNPPHRIVGFFIQSKDNADSQASSNETSSSQFGF